MKISTPLPAKALAWSESLNLEPDHELRGEGYLRLAGKLAEEEQWQAAAEIYQRLIDDDAPSLALKHEAETRMRLLLDQGAFGQRFEHWTRHFARHAADPTALAAMTAGGLAYRVTRVAVAGRLLNVAASPLTRGLVARSLAVSAGFSAELLAFTSVARASASTSTSWPQDIAHASLSLGALKLSGGAANALTGRTLAAGARSPLLFSAFQQSSMLGGILLGAQLETAAALRPQGMDPWEALSTLLHFNIGGQLSRRWLGSRFAGLENRLDQNWRELTWRGSSGTGARLAFAGGGARYAEEFRPSIERATQAPHFLNERHGTESGLTPPVVRDLEAKYLRLFPRDEQGFYSQEIVKRSCRIPCDLPGFHENLLEALLSSPRRGELSQLYTVYAIERIFNTDALGTSRGSFGYAPLQLLLGNVLSESDPGLRRLAMSAILATFDRGFSRADSAELMLNFTRLPHSPAQEKPTYDQRFYSLHGDEANRAWESYRPHDLVPLFNFVHRESLLHPAVAGPIIETLGRGRAEGSPYFASEIDAAIDYARFYPYGDLVLRRLHHIFESGDLPGKLIEITGEASNIPTERYVRTLTQNGHSADDIAETLNGSVHTAYFNDMRLAKKVTSVFQDIAPFLANPKLRDANRARLVEAMMDHIVLHRSFRTVDFFKLLQFGSYPLAEFFERAWMERQFILEVLPDDAFQRELSASGLQVADCEFSLFRRVRGGPDRILLRALPPLSIRRPSERDQSFSQVVWRLRGMIHELQHWSDFNGIGPEGTFKPFKLVGISPEERLISEIMAYVEEFRWQAMNHDDHYLQIARRLGDTVPLYLRNVAEQSYSKEFGTRSRP